MSLIAIIPARAGSKGLPKKNIKLLAGRPLVAHTITAAMKSNVFDKVLVTSDDVEVLQIASDLGACSIHRPQELAGDDVTMALVVRHVLGLCEASEAKAFALLQPTSPLRTAEHIKECAGLFMAGNYSSAVSVCSLDHPPQKAMLIENSHLLPLVSWKMLNQNRQQLNLTYRQNGAMWFVNLEKFMSEDRFVIDPAMPFIMDDVNSIDIDNANDFAVAEKLLLTNNLNV